MDTFNFMLTILLMFMGIQFGQTWIVLAILVISIITSKELSTTIALLAATGVLYFLSVSSDLESLWVPAIFGLVVLALLLGNKPEEQPAGGGLDMLGGLGGYGGMGGMG